MSANDVQQSVDAPLSSETPITSAGRTDEPSRGRFTFRFLAIVLLCVYAFGLTRDVREPWIGLHDWNGAFFSQLARNFIRYPSAIHHGMPVVAVGSDVPPLDERSIYATHPPALVWLVTAAFRVFGESEWAARLVPIVFSLATFAILLWIVAIAYGRAASLLAGLFYAFMPMTVFYGRMVDHEAICLFCMVAAVAGWLIARRSRRTGLSIIIATIWLGIWVDWSMALFWGGASIALVVAIVRRRVARIEAWTIILGGGSAVVAMVFFLVYAGLDGRWGDLFAIFLSRSGEGVYIVERPGAGNWSIHLIDNISRGLTLLAAAGLVVGALTRKSRSMADGANGNRSTAARQGLRLVAMTGILWIAIFFEQFGRHGYWMFYLGPVIAVAAACGIMTIVDISRRHGARRTAWAMFVLAVVVAAYEWQATTALFERVDRPLEEIQDYQAVDRALPPDARVVVFQNPFRVEKRGRYVFQNIIPPQLAWYMDRRMTVERDIDGIAKLAETHAAALIPSRDADRLRERLRPLLEGRPVLVLKGQILVLLQHSQNTSGQLP